MRAFLDEHIHHPPRKECSHVHADRAFPLPAFSAHHGVLLLCVAVTYIRAVFSDCTPSYGSYLTTCTRVPYFAAYDARTASRTVTEQSTMVPRSRLRPPGRLRSWICFVPVHMSLHASGYATAVYISRAYICRENADAMAGTSSSSSFPPCGG